MKLKPIDQQVVVIAGATSGIGRETALRFAERGAKVVVSGRSLPGLMNLVDEIRQKGGQATAIEADVSDFEQVKSLADRAVETYGSIDTWVHPAAVSMYATFTDTRPEEFKRVIDVNLMGQVYGAMAALPHMERQGRGALIHITSVEAKRSLPLQSAYSASKHGVRGFVNALRMELEHEGKGIAVTNIMPASINTPLFEKALTRLGVKPRPIPPVYEPGLVADAIMYAAENPVRELYVGGAGKGLGMAQRLSPRLAERALQKMGFQGQKSQQPKSTNAPNNLFRHLNGFDRVRGDFGQEAKSGSLYTWIRTHPVVKWGALASMLGAVTLLARRALRSR